MQTFTIIRYYLENGLPIEERTTYLLGGTLIITDGDVMVRLTDPRAVPLGPSLLLTARVGNVKPNLWYASSFLNSACDVAGAVAAHPHGIVPPGHWMWNAVELGPIRPGVTFCDKGEYDQHCRHMAELVRGN